MVESRSQVKAQPPLARYSLAELELFPRLTREGYRERHGEQAPAWDKTRRIQRWFDTAALEGEGDPRERMVSYEVFDAAKGEFRTMRMTAWEAGTPNLPGVVSYPKYVVAPTRAVLRSVIDGTETPLNPNYLCELEEARQVARELGVDEGGVRQSDFGGPWRHVWNGETRRLWTVEWKGMRLQASVLLMMRHQQGVGAPGHWDVSGAEPVWIAEVQGDTGERDPRPEMPIPVRRPLANERLEQGLGGLWTVVRTDLSPPSHEELLARVDRRLARLMEHFDLAA
jgi:hypothetical protein